MANTIVIKVCGLPRTGKSTVMQDISDALAPFGYAVQAPECAPEGLQNRRRQSVKQAPTLLLLQEENLRSSPERK